MKNKPNISKMINVMPLREIVDELLKLKKDYQDDLVDTCIELGTSLVEDLNKLISIVQAKIDKGEPVTGHPLWDELDTKLRHTGMTVETLISANEGSGERLSL
jgi:hypothetical protein